LGLIEVAAYLAIIKLIAIFVAAQLGGKSTLGKALATIYG
jgi:hypothetical protein